MRQLEKHDKNSKSLLANVLDLEDDFLVCSRSSFNVAGKPEFSNPPPTMIPHSFQYPRHSNSDTNLSSAITEPSSGIKTTPHNSQFLGKYGHFKQTLKCFKKAVTNYISSMEQFRLNAFIF